MKGALAVAGRVLLGVRGDHVTLAFVVGTPVLVLFLFGQVLGAVPRTAYDARAIHPVLLATFLFFLTYVLTGIGFLRERSRGTLERLQTTRASRLGIVVGYFLGYGALALVQSSILLGAGILFLDVQFAHGIAGFYLLELLGASTALGFGILISILARTEFQVLQSVPVFLSPQLILGGVFVPVANLPAWLGAIARVLPFTHLIAGMQYLVLGTGSANDLWAAVAVLGGCTLASLAAAVLAVRHAG